LGGTWHLLTWSTLRSSAYSRSHPSQSPVVLRVSFLQRNPVQSTLSPMQLPRSYDKQSKEAINHLPRKDHERRQQSTGRSNNTEGALEGKGLNPSGRSPIPRTKETGAVVCLSKQKFKSRPSSYFPGRSCQPVWL
jgi:hypothetical protein